MTQAFAPEFELGAAERQVLATIWRRGPIARSEIAHHTGFAAAYITRLTRDLEGRGLVIDTVQRNGGRGQPLRPLTLAPRGAFAFGVNFSHSFIDVGLIDLAGNLVTHERADLSRARPATLAEHSATALERHLAQSGIPRERVVGAGFSVPGDFRPDGGRLNAHAYFPDLQNVDIRAELAPLFPVPVLIENDAGSAAVGERVHGQGAAFHRAFLFVHIGHGVGGGLVLEERLYRGAFGNAGMIGPLWPISRPRPSGQDLLETLAKEGLDVNDFTGLEGVPLDHPALQAWLKRAGSQLAEGLYLVARCFDVEAVILGGRLPPNILEALFEQTDLPAKFAREPTLAGPTFLMSKMGSYAGVVGAASQCFFRAFFEAT